MVPGSLGCLLWLWLGQWSGWLAPKRSLDGTCSLTSKDDASWEGLANTFSWVGSKHAQGLCFRTCLSLAAVLWFQVLYRMEGFKNTFYHPFNVTILS